MAGLLLLLPAILLGCRAAPERPMNLLLISLDNLRADRLGAYGYERQTSPAVDDLAERTLVFENAYSQAPVTAPSHMSLLTGVLPPTHGIRNFRVGRVQSLSPELPTLATLLAEHGYRRAAFTAGRNISAEMGFGRGFEHYEERMGDRRRLRRARRVITEPSERPFFVFYHSYAPHDPYTPPTRFQELFVDPDYAGEIVSAAPRDRSRFKEHHDAFWANVDDRSPEDLRHLQDLYDAGVRWADGIVAELLAMLEEGGVAEETVVVVLSDHGEQFREHGGWRHADVYQELLHVPLIVSIPGERGEAYRGRRVERVVRLIDVLPTVLAILGVPAPGHLHGRNLLPRLDAEDDESTSVFSQYPGSGLFALRSGNWKLIQRSTRFDDGSVPQRWELYDVAADPEERIDLLATSPEEHAEVFARLRRELERIVALARSQGEALAAGDTIELELETRRQLEALGYR